jgi:hypothetical protein
VKRLRRNLPLILLAVAILGMITVSGHAKKPAPPPVPTSVEVTGPIQGTGDPNAIRVTFDDSLAYTYPAGCTQGPVFISNPDRTRSLYVINIAGPMRKALRYYYCAHEDHENSIHLICNNDEHNPNYYHCLTIGHDITKNKNPNADFDHVIFPTGSPWGISWKYDNSTVAEGTLSIETTYDVIE